MNISYNWLKDYLDFDLAPEKVTEALTSIGLKKFETVFPTTLEGAVSYYEENEPKGEYVLVLEIGRAHV